MGEKLVKYYEFVTQKAGAKGAMRLALMTMVPSRKAQGAEETPEIVSKFHTAAKLITGEEPPVEQGD